MLITKTGRFVDFGFDAEQKYSQSIQREDSDSGSDENDSPRSDLLLFRHFKMMLHDQKVNLQLIYKLVEFIFQQELKENPLFK